MNTPGSPISRRKSRRLLAIASRKVVCQSSVLPASPSSGISEIAQDPHKKRKNAGESCRHKTTISVLADYVFLEIFDFYRNSHNPEKGGPVWKWHILAQVCQRWRQIVFASPRRLDLQILCTNKIPVRRNLRIWPALPIAIIYRNSKRPKGEDSITAALNHSDRVCHVELNIKSFQLVKIANVTKKPFPVLARLLLISDDGHAPVLPDEFLGGSAPCLQTFTLGGIPYPALPTLLFSASNLVKLDYRKIPPAGYISPMAMVACLAALPRLQAFLIGFHSASSRPDRVFLPPVTRRVLPALRSFEFTGASEYLEHLVTQIDSPRLNRIYVDYLNQLVDFQVSQLSKFIDRSVAPELTLLRHAEVHFQSDWVSFTMYPRATHPFSDWRTSRTIISCEGLDWQVSHMAQVLSQFSATISTVVHLKLNADKYPGSQGRGDVEWRHLLRQFPTVQTLYVFWGFAAVISLVLEDITEEMVVEVLPSLDLIYLGGYPASIEKFIAARQRSGRPVTVIRTRTEFEERLKSYDSK